jgi:tetratricopeptide (TPR) repeat protein
MLEQAIKFIGEGKFPEAKELLTGLLHADQNNATYWVWMSAAMETQKERLYCLQMAYKMDPANTAARRGLVLMGALSPDDSLAPFPMNHPRPWEVKLKLADEKPQPTGIKRVTENPFIRLAVIGVVVIAVVGGAIFGLGALINANRRVAAPINLTPATPRPTVTPVVNKNAPTLNATIVPLADLLKGGTYTPTPIYALTPHGDVALDAYHGAMRAYSQGRWSDMADMMAQIGTSQPGSVDTLYFIAEADRLSGQFADAIDYYKQAIKLNANFAPSYLGRARADLALNPQKSVIADLNKAISLDPNFSEAYLERGLYSLKRQNLPAAKSDLVQAASLNPGSPVIQVNLARVLLAVGENQAALDAAQKANQLDITMLDGYLVLGMAYRANGQIDQAVDVLDTYTKYLLTNPEAFTVLASAYFSRGDYPTALKNVDQAILLDKNSAEAYRWRGEIYLATKEYTKALSDFRQSYRTNVTFEAGIGIVRSMIALQDFSNAYGTVLITEKLVKTDQQRGIFLYYGAIALEGLNEQVAASRNWTSLLALPAAATTDQMRADAKAHIIALQSATPPPPGATVTVTPTPTPKK